MPEVAGWVREYYRLPGNSVGGSLHVVLDDKNVEDSNVEFCRRYAIAEGDVEGERLAQTLATMTRTQRLKLCDTPGKHSNG